MEQDNKKKEDEDTRKEIERSAVEEYKRQQQLLKEQTTAREEQFRKQLAELNLDAEQVDAVLAIPSLNLGETPFDAAALSNINLQDAASSTPTERGPRAKSRSRLNIGGIFGLCVSFLPLFLWGRKADQRHKELVEKLAWICTSA